jgi:hypothetical protein
MGAIVASYVNVSSGRPSAPERFVEGFQHALVVAAAIAFAAAVVAVVTVRKHRHAEPGKLVEAAALD